MDGFLTVVHSRHLTADAFLTVVYSRHLTKCLNVFISTLSKSRESSMSFYETKNDKNNFSSILCFNCEKNLLTDALFFGKSQPIKFLEK